MEEGRGWGHLQEQSRGGKSWLWALLIPRQLSDFRMKMGGRQVEIKVSSYISEHIPFTKLVL